MFWSKDHEVVKSWRQRPPNNISNGPRKVHGTGSRLPPTLSPSGTGAPPPSPFTLRVLRGYFAGMLREGCLAMPLATVARCQKWRDDGKELSSALFSGLCH